MRLYEFANDDPLRVKLIAVTSQLQSRIEDTNAEAHMSTDALLELLKQNDIIIDKTDLYDIVQKEPLKNIIKNINGNNVVFVGQKNDKLTEPADMGAPEDTAKTLKAMASRAIK